MSGDPTERLIHSYGRRRGRRLRAGRAALVDDFLPQIAIHKPDAGAVIDPAALFGRKVDEVWLEIGFGGGEHLAHQAATHRHIGLIGAEPYINGYATLLARLREQALDNVRLWTDDIRLLLPHFPAGSLARVFILFPDPWPKARHHKRRLIAASFLEEIARVLRADGELRLATDDEDYLAWMLERLTIHPAFEWLARRADDWRVRPADSPPTRYETKAIAQGRMPVYLRFRRRAG